MTLSDARASLPPLLDLINEFGQLSGFTVNWQKSLFMPLADGLDSEFINGLPFKVTTDHFVYLGIKIARNPKLLFKLNYSEMIDKLKTLVEKWKLLPISLIGRVNIIKMVVLPKFLYLFQNVPIFLTASFFKTIDSIILPFIWSYKSFRISKIHLQKPVADGGLGLPVFRHYYWACNARTWVYWNHTPAVTGQVDARCPSWPTIESHTALSSTGTSLAAIIFTESNFKMSQLKDDFILRNSYNFYRDKRISYIVPSLGKSKNMSLQGELSF